MNKKIILTILAALSITLLTMRPAYAPIVRAPGVSHGDSATYGDLSFTWNSNDPNAKPPNLVDQANETQSFGGTVTSVVGSNVTLSTSQHLRNGTDINDDEWIDVDSGQSGSSSGNGNLTMYILAANLNATDPVYSGVDFTNVKINDTVLRYYPSGARMTNHMNITMSVNIHTPFVLAFNLSINQYWDKATGVMTELTESFANDTGVYLTTWTASIKLTDSNVWTVPEYPTLAPILTIMATATITALMFRPRLRRNKSQ